MHISVLTKEVLEFLSPQSGQKFIDATAGAGGHSLAILKKIAPDGKLLAIDLDRDALARVAKRIETESPNLKSNLILAQGNFADIEKIAAAKGLIAVDGVVADLGLSSDQLGMSGRGFSFQKDEPLDMRFDIRQKLTAREIINQWLPADLERIFREYGEEKFSRRIAQSIIKRRQIKPILTTQELVEAIASAVPARHKNARIHFATRIFQALRISTNDELGNLERFISQAIDTLKSGGRLAIISFHSLEDRIVKNLFRQAAKNSQGKILTKKPLSPMADEQVENPRSRSAKMRVIQKL